MKKITFLILSVSALLQSCSSDKKTSPVEEKMTQNEIVKKNIENQLMQSMHDTSSYEFVKIQLIDSILFIENINYRTEYFKNDISSIESNIKRIENYKTSLPALYNEKELKRESEKLNRNKIILSKIDSLKKIIASDTNKVASYTYLFGFRGKNKLGAKILSNYFVQTKTSPDFEIINMVKDKNKLYLNPNDFPGYRETINKLY